VEVKSKFDAEFRRFSVSRQDAGKYKEFRGLIERLHHLADVPFLISYTDPRDGDAVDLCNKKAHGDTVEALRYKTEGGGFDFQWCHWNL